MSDQKPEFPRDLSWVYLNNQLLEMSEDKRRKAIERLVSNPNPEYSLAVLVLISDVPEDLARKALENIFELKRIGSNYIFGYDSAVMALIAKFLSALPHYLKEDFCKMCLGSGEVTYYHLSLVYREIPDLSGELRRKLLEKILEMAGQDSYRPTNTRNLVKYISLENLPDDLRREAMERLIRENSFSFLVDINNPPEELKKHAIELNRQGWPTDEMEVMRAIDSILPEWMIGERDSPVFQRINNIPVFRPGNWEILDRTKDEKPEMILLRGKSRHRRDDDVAVLLLKDISHDNLGYAIQVPPDVKKVKEAHAYTCRQDPETFDGFEKEV